MRFVLCSTSRQVHQYHDLCVTHEPLSIVALTPEASWACQQQGLVYRRPEDFVDDSELSSRTEELFSLALTWVSDTDRFLQERIPAFAQAEFRPAQAWDHIFQLWLGEFFRGSILLRCIFEQAKPDKVLYWPQATTQPRWNLISAEPIVTALVRGVAPAYQVSVEELCDRPDTPVHAPELYRECHSSRSGSLLEHISRRHITPLIMAAQRRLSENRLWAEARQIYRVGPAEYVRALPGLFGARGAVLVIGRGYDMDAAVAVLRRRGLWVDWLDMYVPGTTSGPLHAKPPLDPELQSTLAALWGEVIAGAAFWRPFEAWSIGRTTRAEVEFAYWWHQIVPHLWSGYQRAQRALGKRHYHAVLAVDAGAETLGGAMVQAAAAAGVPRIIYQHGSTSRIRALVWNHYLLHADRLLVYGSGTARLIERDRPAIPQANATVSSVGSARLDLLIRQAKSQLNVGLGKTLRGQDPRPMVLYVPTNFGGNARVFIEQAGYPDVSYFELQQRILRIFREFPGVRLLYKDFTLATSGRNPVPDFIRQELPDITVVHDLPLTRLMWAVDAIVIDHAITALGEVLLTKKRLVVYDPDPIDGLELPDARDLLRRRAAVATTPDEFESAVRALLAAGDFSALEQPDDSFLRAYCTHHNDGRSAERAADEILRVMERR